ncbi:MAG: type II CAAX prenyl endopeptidase Rce1 family protein [Acidobacteriota bacterium]
MQLFLIAFFLILVLGLLAAAVQERARALLRAKRRAIWLVPAALTLLFAAVLGVRTPFVALAAVYLFVPTALVYFGRRPWLDFTAILLLWLPVEFAAGRDLLPRSAWGVANLTARGASIVLALALFLLYREMKGMKYNLPSRWTDLAYPALAFAAAAPVLIALGLWMGYMGPYRASPYGPAGFALLWGKTLLGVAIPEELLFRALIQNWLMQRFGFSHRTLFAAALIFGASHLNNGPGPLPNWRYLILATIAGFVFGKVFWKSSTILSSASLHALVNSVRHAFFL